jgi:hypothetical protein
LHPALLAPHNELLAFNKTIRAIRFWLTGLRQVSNSVLSAFQSGRRMEVDRGSGKERRLRILPRCLALARSRPLQEKIMKKQANGRDVIIERQD